MAWRTGETVVADFPTRGAAGAVNADSLPTGTLVINGTDNGATVTVTNKATGKYKFSVVLPTTVEGDLLQVRIAATVDGVSDNEIVWAGRTSYSLPYALPGAAGGSLIAGSNAATTFATLTSTGAFSINGTSHVAQTGDSYAIVNSGTFGNAAIYAKVDTEIATIITNQTTINNNVGALITTVGVAGAGLTEVSVSNAGKSAIAVAIFDETKSSVQVGSWGGFIDGLATQASVSALLTTALTEGYRATNATGSVRDLLYEIIAHMGESSIASTTKTLKKLDGSTTAKTYTLNDATTPTSITETT